MEDSFNSKDSNTDKNIDNNTDNNLDNNTDNIYDNNTNNNTDSRFLDSYYENEDNNDEHLASLQNRLNSSIISSQSSCSMSSFNITINSNTSHITKKDKKVKIITSKQEKYFFCIKCKKFYIIEFKSNYLIKIECDCLIKDCTIDQFFQKYIITDFEVVRKNSYCKFHINKMYRIYCKDCRVDACEDCEKETNQYNNIETIIKVHETHGIIYIQDEIKKKIEDLKIILKSLKENVPHGLNDVRRILNLILNLINYHQNFYSYNLYKTLDNALNFCSKFELPNFQEMIKISNIKQLEENRNNIQRIISIDLNGQNLSDISAFKNSNFKSLKFLNLNKNKIEDITPLENCNFENLEIFDIEENLLNNNNVKILKQFIMPKVTRFNLYDNKFTTTEIITIVKNFPNVEQYFVGKNQFDKEELDKNQIYVFPDKLIEFGLTENLTQETSDFILKLKIEKIKTFYISRNKLTTLSFLEKLKFENLEEIWPSFNYLEDLKEIQYIQSKKTIKKISLKGNKIKNIDNILDIIKDFPSLREIILENNPINFIDENIKKKLKEKNIIFKI